MENSYEKLVEVIEDGRIAKVPEFYARKEGLPILRRVSAGKAEEEPESVSQIPISEIGVKGMILDNFRKPDWREKQVLSELVENFHWIIRIERRRKGFTRKQLAKKINEREEVLKMIENGVLPTKDFVLINKIQNALGVNLRKDKKDYSKSAHDIMREHEEISEQKKKESQKRLEDKELNDIYGSDIEILGDF